MECEINEMKYVGLVFAMKQQTFLCWVTW